MVHVCQMVPGWFVVLSTWVWFVLTGAAGAAAPSAAHEFLAAWDR